MQTKDRNEAADLSNWTLVTGYFDLTGAPDATAAIKSRPASYYIDRYGTSTFALDHNLMVFCEPHMVDKITLMRPRELLPKTSFVPMHFDGFPLTQYREAIIGNRGGGACGADPRNTASYYLFCMARYAMCKQAIAINPFNSTHFAWINIDIERMGMKNLVHLDEALGQHRDKFSTCYIDYVPRSVVANLADYFGLHGCKQCQARCSMCSGFFTGNAHYMKAVCDQLEAQFLRCLKAGYGHADEQLYSIVYFDQPELFDWYVGDYSEMITNYAHVNDRADAPIKNLIRHSMDAGDWAVCSRACDIVWNSYVSGKCSLWPPDLDVLTKIKATSAWRLGAEKAPARAS